MKAVDHAQCAVSAYVIMYSERRVRVEVVDTVTGDVIKTGTARMRGVTVDDYQTRFGGELRLDPGQAFVVVGYADEDV